MTSPADITERKLAEVEVRQLAAIVDSCSDAILSTDSHFNVTSWNRGAQTLYGYSAAEMIGRPVSILIPEHRAVEHQTIVDLVLAGEYVENYETERVAKDGNLIEVSLTLSPIYDRSGEIIGASSIARDVTAQKQASQYARSLIEVSLDPLVTISPEGKITDVNEATTKVTGVERERLIGTEFSDYFTEPEKARDGYRRVFAEGSVTDYPLTIRHRDGKLTDVLYNASVYSDSAGNVLGVFAAARDVTAQKRAITERSRAEQQILELNATLEQRVLRRTAELEAANLELEAFSYSLAHDLRSPLRAIDGFGAALVRRCAEQLGDDGREMLDRMRGASVRMGELIDAMLLLSELTRRELSLERLDLSGIARGIADEMRSQDSSRKVEFVIEDGLDAVGDPQLVHILLRNLLENAWKFTEPREHARIEVVSARPGVFAIRDNGAGFNMDFADLLFKPFARLHREDEFPGAGVGLTTAERIVRRHGGAIWGEGQPDVGATFYFALEPEKETES